MIPIEKNKKFFMQNDASVFSVRDKDNIDCSEHRHDFVEMVYMLKGRCVHIIDGVEYPTRRGDLIIINYNRTHAIVGGVNAEYANILMKPEYINSSLKNSENAFSLLMLSEFENFREVLDENKCKVTFLGEERTRIEDIINVIIEEMSQKNPGYELAIRSQFNLLIIMIFRKMSFDINHYFDGVSEKLLSYINQHCHEKLSLEDMAKMCSYNPSYFSRIFKENTGENFTSYLKKVRIKKAAELLTKTDRKVMDIIYEVGYSDRTKFFSHFKAIMGTSPNKYRKGKK